MVVQEADPERHVQSRSDKHKHWGRDISGSQINQVYVTPKTSNGEVVQYTEPLPYHFEICRIFVAKI